jgi:hypothetical protein
MKRCDNCKFWSLWAYLEPSPLPAIGHCCFEQTVVEFKTGVQRVVTAVRGLTGNDYKCDDFQRKDDE